MGSYVVSTWEKGHIFFVCISLSLIMHDQSLLANNVSSAGYKPHLGLNPPAGSATQTSN